jgi:diguanylate cyclase (GGDEF)-like protein
VSSDPPEPSPAASGLRLDAALQLLVQSGRELPGRDDPAWLQAVLDALCDISSRDALTGLANRRQFELALAREIDRVARSGEPALLLMVDIDHFKRVNDLHGHLVGDRVIQAVASRLTECVRPMDTVARYGGEEFAIILPNCPPTFGHAVAERIRGCIEQQPATTEAGAPINVTISLGGAFAPQWVRSTAPLWLARADRQLYRAKAEGRNRTCLEQPPDSQVSAEEKSLLLGFSQFDFEFE